MPELAVGVNVVLARSDQDPVAYLVVENFSSSTLFHFRCSVRVTGQEWIPVQSLFLPLLPEKNYVGQHKPEPQYEALIGEGGIYLQPNSRYSYYQYLDNLGIAKSEATRLEFKYSYTKASGEEVPETEIKHPVIVRR
jgi:hypothetical protein